MININDLINLLNDDICNGVMKHKLEGIWKYGNDMKMFHVREDYDILVNTISIYDINDVPTLNYLDGVMSHIGCKYYIEGIDDIGVGIVIIEINKA